MKKLALLLLILPIQLMAETLYVGDSLRVGIRPEPSKNVASISIIKTGASVEILARKNSYAKIRTQSGIEGWVKSAYLTRKTPANKKLKTANKKIKTLEQELKTLQQSSGEETAKSQHKLQAIITQLQTEKDSMLEEINQLKKQPTVAVAVAVAASTDSHHLQIAGFNLSNINKDLLYIILGGIFAILILGFLFGVSWYKQQVTKRLGGLSI